MLEEGVYPPDFRAFVSAVFFDDIYEDANPENISQNAYMQVGDEVYLTHSSARLSGSKTLVGEARDEAKRAVLQGYILQLLQQRELRCKGTAFNQLRVLGGLC